MASSAPGSSKAQHDSSSRTGWTSPARGGPPLAPKPSCTCAPSSPTATSTSTGNGTNSKTSAATTSTTTNNSILQPDPQLTAEEPHPLGNAWAGSRRSRRGTLAPRSAPTRAPPPSARPYRPHSGYRGPWSHLSWVSPPLGPDQGNSYPTTCGSTVCRDGPSTSPRTVRSSRRRPRPLRRSSSPSATHPTPAAWGCNTTCPATSAHSCDSLPFG